uniref:Endonuclease/exonuclease/phosphatase domain-containing protein n=1 Tax=Tetranychus urticae TaxID=32264 RepID=T1JR48_TETUR
MQDTLNDVFQTLKKNHLINKFFDSWYKENSSTLVDIINELLSSDPEIFIQRKGITQIVVIGLTQLISSAICCGAHNNLIPAIQKLGKAALLLDVSFDTASNLSSSSSQDFSSPPTVSHSLVDEQFAILSTLINWEPPQSLTQAIARNIRTGSRRVKLNSILINPIPERFVPLITDLNSENILPVVVDWHCLSQFTKSEEPLKKPLAAYLNSILPRKDFVLTSTLKPDWGTRDLQQHTLLLNIVHWNVGKMRNRMINLLDSVMSNKHDIISINEPSPLLTAQLLQNSLENFKPVNDHYHLYYTNNLLTLIKRSIKQKQITTFMDYLIHIELNSIHYLSAYIAHAGSRFRHNQQTDRWQSLYGPKKLINHNTPDSSNYTFCRSHDDVRTWIDTILLSDSFTILHSSTIVQNCDHSILEVIIQCPVNPPPPLPRHRKIIKLKTTKLKLRNSHIRPNSLSRNSPLIKNIKTVMLFVKHNSSTRLKPWFKLSRGLRKLNAKKKKLTKDKNWVAHEAISEKISSKRQKHESIPILNSKFANSDTKELWSWIEKKLLISSKQKSIDKNQILNAHQLNSIDFQLSSFTTKPPSYDDSGFFPCIGKLYLTEWQKAFQQSYLDSIPTAK